MVAIYFYYIFKTINIEYWILFPRILNNTTLGFQTTWTSGEVGY